MKLERIAHVLRGVFITPIPGQPSRIGAAVEAHVAVIVGMVDACAGRAGNGPAGREVRFEIKTDAGPETKSIWIRYVYDLGLILCEGGRSGGEGAGGGKEQWFHNASQTVKAVRRRGRSGCQVRSEG